MGKPFLTHIDAWVKLPRDNPWLGIAKNQQFWLSIMVQEGNVA